MISDKIFQGTWRAVNEVHLYAWQDLKWCKKGASVHYIVASSSVTPPPAADEDTGEEMREHAHSHTGAV